MANAAPTVHVNGTEYRWPKRPVVVVCIDGGDPAYIQQFLKDGVIPNIARFMQRGLRGVADGTVPCFTCPNNMSMITGTPASKHGISGNYYLDAATGEAIVMTGPELLRGDTILAQFAKAGAKVVSITAKDKLRQQLGKDLDLSNGNISFSSEKADQCTMAENGIENVLAFVGQPLPDMYSEELSLFVLDAGIKLLERDRPRPHVPVAHRLRAAQVRARPRRRREASTRTSTSASGGSAALGAIVALTADHGMNDKSNARRQAQRDLAAGHARRDVRQGRHPRDLPDHRRLRRPPRRARRLRARLVHGQGHAAQVIDVIRGIPGIESVLDKETACGVLDLPADREADVVVISTPDVCIGGAEKDHDLSGLEGHRLRTHGGVSEAKVPFILSRPLNDEYKLKGGAGILKSYQIFEFAINGAAALMPHRQRT